MNKNKISLIVFGGATITAFLLYFLTASVWTPPVEAWSKAHKFWAYWLDVFGGRADLLSMTFAALGVGISAWFATRFANWLMGITVALLMMFMPGIWNSATRSGLTAMYFGWIMLGLWTLNLICQKVFARAIKANSELPRQNIVSASKDSVETYKHYHHKKLTTQDYQLYTKYLFFGAAVIFALWGLTHHEYRYGMAEKVFEADIARAAGDRWIVAVEGESPDGRQALMERVKKEFPEDDDLHTAVQISEVAFYEAALKKYPEKFYVKSIGDTLRGNVATNALPVWEQRWEHVREFLNCNDPFIARMRRKFAFEGNAIGNALQEENLADKAWEVYYRIFTEIEPKNFSAIVNLNEMVRRGYKAKEAEYAKAKSTLDDLFKNKKFVEHVREIALAAGPVRADKELIAKFKAEQQQRIAEKQANGEELSVAPEIKQLIDWNNQMVKYANNGDLETAGSIARKILANPKWRNFVPANAIMGSVVAKEGDYVASEQFFRAAVSTTNAVPPLVMNNFATTLMNLGKLEEAEQWARKAVAATPEKDWVMRITLIEVLAKAGVKLDEAKGLFEATERFIPKTVRKNLTYLKKMLYGAED